MNTTTKTLRRPWSVQEFRRMWTLKNRGLSNRRISEQIGRSPAAISKMVSETHDYMSR